MKKIVLLISAILMGGLFLTSCEEKETSFDAITSVPDPAAGFFVQFTDPLKSLETKVSESGGLIEIQTPIAVELMGMPQTSPVTVTLTVDPSSTITANQYTLSSNSMTIAAGKSSASVTLKTVAANMTPGATVKLVLNMNAPDHNSPNPNGIKLIYNLKRMEFCPLVNGVADLAGHWSGEDAYYDADITMVVEGTKLRVSGMSEMFIQDWWAETIVSGGNFLMTVAGNGLVDIPRQHIYTTVYGGANYNYDIKGSGEWKNCGATPTLHITYDIYYEGEADGLAKTYASYLDGIPYLTADISLDAGKKSAPVPVSHPEIQKVRK